MLPGRDIAGTILEYARRKNVTHILIGKSERSRWFELLHGSVVRDLMRDSGAISVTAVLAARRQRSRPKTVATAAAPQDGSWRRIYLKQPAPLPITVLAGMALRGRVQSGTGQHRHALPGAGDGQRRVLWTAASLVHGLC